MEEQLINIISQSISNPEDIGDDCAVVKLAGEDYLFCLDNFIENTHFSSEYFSPADIGWKSLAVNISDIASMAGEPLFALVGLSLSEKISDKKTWVKEFYQGMQDCADKFNCKIIGGDISSQKDFTSISVTAIGKTKKALLRKVEEKQDYEICVTGKFGNSKSFLDSFTNNKKIIEADRAYHLRPMPRVKEAQALSQGALIDSSDGLAASLWTLAEMNTASIEIDSSLIPRDDHVSLDQVFYGGEDYELVGLFTKCPENFQKIGVMTYKDNQVKVYDSALKQNVDKSKQYQHF